MFFNNICKIIYVDGMKCNHCVHKIKSSLSNIDGIKKVKIDLDNKSVKIYSKREINNDIIVKNIEDIGFKVMSSS